MKILKKLKTLKTLKWTKSGKKNYLSKCKSPSICYLKGEIEKTLLLQIPHIPLSFTNLLHATT